MEIFQIKTKLTAMRVFRTILIILPLTFAACATAPSEPDIFSAELISFEATTVPLPLPDMGPIYEPGYLLKFRRGPLTNYPNKLDRTSYNVALMDCDNEAYIFQSSWFYLIDQSDSESAIYEAPFYKFDFDRLDFPTLLCARVLVGKRKIETKGVGFEKVKRPVLISNKIQLRIPN